MGEGGEVTFDKSTNRTVVHCNRREGRVWMGETCVFVDMVGEGSC